MSPRIQSLLQQLIYDVKVFLECCSGKSSKVLMKNISECLEKCKGEKGVDCVAFCERVWKKNDAAHTITTDGTQESHIGARNMATSTWRLDGIVRGNIQNWINIGRASSVVKSMVERVHMEEGVRG